MAGDKIVLGERWSMADQMEQQRAAQARIRLEAEVRAAALKGGADRKEADEMVARSREVFVIVNGEAQAMAGKTALMAGDGAGLLSVAEWVERQGPAPRPAATLGPSPVAVPVARKNPWRRVSWNLTEQMRISRRDPELAGRLQAEAAE
jgi:hypothetical protein